MIRDDTMADLDGTGHYAAARKLALKNYSNNVSKGHIGYLPSLEGLLKDTEIFSQINLGNVEIPLKKIAGTYTHSRSLAFASNFMPLLSPNTEFGQKWAMLCDAHLNEGINHSIKVYEFMNWFYVIEGNKRVSVLKYFDAYSMSANVIRLMPQRDPSNIDNCIYYEFLKFYSITKINSIWFTMIGNFDKLTKLIENYTPKSDTFENKYKYFEKYIYNVFRNVYYKLGGNNLPITTGDALLEYCNIYGIPDNFDEAELEKTLKELIKELEFYNGKNKVIIQTDPPEPVQKNMLSTLTSFISSGKKLNAAFVYARTIESSGWTYGHELGRKYVDEVLGDTVSTSFVENVPENEEAYSYIRQLAENGNDIIFTTSPVFMNATLKCSLEFPHTKFFNCSENQPYKHLSNYFGRTYEPRFLTGIIAGSLTKTNILGYAATSPTPEVISCINAFALGARLVNPYAMIKVAWTNEWNSHIKFSDADEKLIKKGADIICNRNLSIPRKVTTKYGIYSMLCTINKETHQAEKYLAAPIWHWGIFYEKIIRNVLNDTYKTVVDMFSSSSDMINFWWGMASGVLDLYCSTKYVPVETQKLIELMKKMLIENDYHPFTGPIYDKDGILRIENDDTASLDQILSMDWYVDNIEVEPFKYQLLQNYCSQENNIHKHL